MRENTALDIEDLRQRFEGKTVHFSSEFFRKNPHIRRLSKVREGSILKAPDYSQRFPLNLAGQSRVIQYTRNTYEQPVFLIELLRECGVSDYELISDPAFKTYYQYFASVEEESAEWE